VTEEIDIQIDDEKSQEFVKRALTATTINWKVVEKWTNKFGYQSTDEMVFDWSLDPQLVYDKGLKAKPFPFHRHIRINLDKMLFCGISSPDEMIDAGLKLTAKQKRDIQAAKEESEEWASYGD
jgi:hypothetical protein|tara:strand:+ start:1521 stop:1889 length:369 start_codon:yes stop_codon:yes gene_type:complete